MAAKKRAAEKKWPSKEVLREKFKIANPHNLAAQFGAARFYLSYRSADRGRGGHGAAWQVVGIDVKTDPTAYWANYGRKTFHVSGRDDKAAQLAAAQAWAKRHFKVDLTERDPFGDYQSKGTLDNVLAAIGEAGS